MLMRPVSLRLSSIGAAGLCFSVCLWNKAETPQQCFSDIWIAYEALIDSGETVESVDFQTAHLGPKSFPLRADEDFYALYIMPGVKTHPYTHQAILSS